MVFSAAVPPRWRPAPVVAFSDVPEESPPWPELPELPLFVVSVPEPPAPWASPPVSAFVVFPVAFEDEPDEGEPDEDESDFEPEEAGGVEFADEPDEPDESDVLDESFATPVSTRMSPEFLLSPESGPQVGQG